MTDRNIAAWEPQENTYALTVILSNVRKTTAKEIAAVIAEFCAEDYDLGDVLVTTAHVKETRYSAAPAKVAKSA